MKGLSIIIFAAFLYLYIVFQIAHVYAQESIDYTQDATLSILSGNRKQSDSLRAISRHYWQKRENTTLWLPKFLR